MAKFFLILCLLPLMSFAKSNKHQHKEHRNHDAHVHGAATLNIAFDKITGKLEFKGASEGVLGFEHIANTEKEKKKLADVITQLESEISKMVKFDSSSECVFSKEKIEMISEKENINHQAKTNKEQIKGEHSDFIATYLINCKKTILGTKLGIDFTKLNNIQDMDVTILIDDFQKSFEVKKNPVEIELK